jgi:ferric-dicitrate binding protein FerR (iron transport regulator)
MSDEYLWNRGGEPDAEIERLEKLLQPLRYKAAPVRAPRRAPVWRWLAAAALVLLCAGLAALVWQRSRDSDSDWQLVNGQRLRAGQLVETGTSGSAAIESQLTGRVEIDAQSRLRLVASAEHQERFDLESGTIHALIWAPPGRFVVDTPSARTIDLGCRYTLHVEPDGTGLVSVETGWVAFEWQKRESFIPAGAACITRPKLGPGTPWFTDAPEALKKALNSFDQAARHDALSAALITARERDALSVWHLMVRTTGEDRGEAFDRFAGLVKLPPNISREAVLRGDADALDGAWNALDLGSTGWWREWKRKW